MKIKVLGTVSPYCKDIYNCPGFLVIENDNKILLDAGNGISRYLNMTEDLNNLTIIISHLHKDHYAELTSIGYASFVLNNLGLIKNKIKVYIPKINKQMTSQELIDYNYLLNFKEDNYLEFREYDENTILKVEDMNVTFSKNIHPVTTYATKIESQNKTIVYSSDTGYKGNTLENFAQNADLLICESSFLKGQIKIKDYHLYASEAALIAKKANVKELVLTHFYPEINKNKYLEEAKAIFENTSVGEENKYIKIKK